MNALQKEIQRRRKRQNYIRSDLMINIFQHDSKYSYNDIFGQLNTPVSQRKGQCVQSGPGGVHWFHFLRVLLNVINVIMS